MNLLLHGLLILTWGAGSALTEFKAYKDEARSGRFKTSGCSRVPPQAWIKYLLLGTPVVHRLEFAQECDLQGTFKITRAPFPVDLAVRNLKEARHFKAQVTPDIAPDLMSQQLTVKVNVGDGVLLSANAAQIFKLKADYQVVSGLDGKPRENSGGTVTVTHYRGQPVTGVQEHLEIK